MRPEEGVFSTGCGGRRGIIYFLYFIFITSNWLFLFILLALSFRPLGAGGGEERGVIPFSISVSPQQHPPFLLLPPSRLLPILTFLWLLLFGLLVEPVSSPLATLDLISSARVKKLSSTLFEFLAEVSKNLIPSESAYCLPSS